MDVTYWIFSLFWLFFLLIAMFVSGDMSLDGMTFPSSHHKNELIIVKYGGSAITDKATFETIKLDVLMKLAEIVAKNKEQNRLFVVIHGAGSFGHFQAKEFELKTGGKHNWLEGLAKTRSSVQRLNNLVIASHVESKLAAVGIPLFPHVRTKGMGQLVESSSGDAFITSIVRLLHTGVLPVIHGDVVFDEIQRCSVFGGDFIMTWLASVLPKALQLKSVKTIFVTDVSGVYDMPPHLPNANLLREIVIQSSGEFLLPQTEQHLHDVTGGIMKKIESARDLALMGCVVFIVPVDGLEDALNGNLPNDKGTKVILR